MALYTVNKVPGYNINIGVNSELVTGGSESRVIKYT